MMQYKIIQFIPQLNYGGAEVLVKNYAFELYNRGYDVIILCIKRYNSLLEKLILEHGIKIVFLDEIANIDRDRKGRINRIANSIKWRLGIKRFFKKEKPDIVHSHMFTGEVLLQARKELRKAKLFYTVHSDPEKYWGDGKNLREKNALFNLNKYNDLTIIALHEEAKRKLDSLFDNSINIKVLNNCVDVDSFQFPSITRNEVLLKYAIPQDSYIIGHVGRFAIPKNHHFLVDVFYEIHKKVQNSYLLLIGDGEKKHEIEDQVSSYELNKYVIFLGIKDDLTSYYQCFDAFVFPSLWEGFPLSLIEAQSARVRCYISDNVSDEAILSNYVQVVSLKKSSEEWADVILNAKPISFVDMGLKNYSIRNVIDTLEHLYFNGR